MENRLILCLSIVGLAWFVRNTFLGFETSDTSDREIKGIFRRIAEEQGRTAVQERICGKHKENTDAHIYEDEEGKKTTFVEDLDEGFCYEVLDSIIDYDYSKEFVRRDVVLVAEDGHIDDDYCEINSEFGPGPTVMSAVLFNSDIRTIKHFKTDKWRLCPTQFSHRTYEFLMLENLFIWRPSSWKGNDPCNILHLGINGGQSHNFINSVLPHIHQTAVQSEGPLVRLAEKWLKTPGNVTEKVVIKEDESTFLSQSKEEGNSYDSIWIHGCAVNEHNIYECPSSKYLVDSILLLMKSLLKADGVIMFRHMAVRKTGEDLLLQEIIQRLTFIFGNCLVDDKFGKLEKIVLCSPRKIPQNRDHQLQTNREQIFQLLLHLNC